jgi:hypothetical protein
MVLIFLLCNSSAFFWLVSVNNRSLVEISQVIQGILARSFNFNRGVNMVIRNPRKLIGVGFVLLVFGFVLPVLMVIGVIASSLWLSILSHAASVSGLLLGLLGVAMVSQVEQERDSTSPNLWE